MASIKEQLSQNGFAIIEDFLTLNQISDLKQAGKKFTEQAFKEQNRCKFSANGSMKTPQASEHYFLESADKVSFFFEMSSFNEHGELKVDPETALNKVGHALHRLEPSCRNVTFHEKVINVCRSIGLQKPAVVQSMYIYKNANIGGEVKPHRDSKFLYTSPTSLYGFWYALDDATLENGCLMFIPGSHKITYPESRFIRNMDETAQELCVERGTDLEFSEEDFLATPVKKGTCILIHGHVVHRSLPNLSNHSRHVYTFHIYDKSVSEYSEENWLQTKFETLYEVRSG